MTRLDVPACGKEPQHQMRGEEHDRGIVVAQSLIIPGRCQVNKWESGHRWPQKAEIDRIL